MKVHYSWKQPGPPLWPCTGRAWQARTMRYTDNAVEVTCALCRSNIQAAKILFTRSYRTRLLKAWARRDQVPAPNLT